MSSYPNLRVIATAAVTKGDSIKVACKTASLPNKVREFNTFQELLESDQFTIDTLSGQITPSHEHPWVFGDVERDAFGARVYNQVTRCALQWHIGDDWVDVPAWLALKATRALTGTHEDALHWKATAHIVTSNGKPSLMRLGSVAAEAPTLDKLMADLGDGEWSGGTFVLTEPLVIVTDHTGFTDEKTSYEIREVIVWYVASDMVHGYSPSS